MSSRLKATSGELKFGGVVCSPNGTIKSPFSLTSSVPVRLRRRFIPLPCELRHDNRARNIMADALVDLFDEGSIEAAGRFQLYTEGGIDHLATIYMDNPAFGDALSGIAVGNNLPWTELSAIGSGTAIDFIAFNRDNQVVLSGNIGDTDEDMVFPFLEIAVNDIVKLLSVSYTAPP